MVRTLCTESTYYVFKNRILKKTAMNSIRHDGLRLYGTKFRTSVRSLFFNCVGFCLKNFPLFFARIFALEEFLPKILAQRIFTLNF